tara:strand:+ start:1428 stop:1616 length:189 start_codon:yes stop_codon:yes gene_type:complete
MAIDRIDEPGDEDLEYYSQCCTAPPLWELDHMSYAIDGDPIGICMNCRDNAVFELNKESQYE